MQTFLPSPSFEQSAKALDRQRLGKQRLEAYQILKTLQGHSDGWAHHPAVKMWRGYEDALAQYYNAIVAEWLKRGYRNNMPYPLPHSPSPEMPPWLGDPSFHLSHQSNLVRKLPSHYAQLFPTVTATLPYVWPRSNNVAI